MVASTASTPEEYIKSLPDEKRAVIEAIRTVILRNLPKGFEEVMQYGMISYVVPLSLYPAGYRNDKKTPLPYLSLAAQKNHYALYSMAVYGNPKLLKWFVDAYKKSGKKLDMGKGCIRGKRLEDFALDVIGQAATKLTVDEYIAQYQKARGL